VVQADVPTPVLSVLVPQSAFESMLAAGNTRRWSAIHIDQPFIRQVDLIRIALPEARRIGVLFDAADPERLLPLKNAVAGTSMQI
ncbi:UNVERIFIED_CONTAM: hypothetical protein IGO34_33640, partial [Salmonella enterica subsp. enterica serovar Weltevreden]